MLCIFSPVMTTILLFVLLRRKLVLLRKMSYLKFYDRGVAYCVKAHQIPLGARNSRGIPLPSVIPIQSNTGISAIFPLMNFTEHEDLILLTKMGFVKKTRLMNFQNINHRGLKMISLVPGDKLMWVRKCPSNKGEIIITTKSV